MALMMLTAAEMAAILRVHPDTLRRWRREGRGPEWVRFGQTVRYVPELDLNSPAAAPKKAERKRRRAA